LLEYQEEKWLIQKFPTLVAELATILTVLRSNRIPEVFDFGYENSLMGNFYG